MIQIWSGNYYYFFFNEENESINQHIQKKKHHLSGTHCQTWDRVHLGLQLSLWQHPGEPPWSESVSRYCCRRTWCVCPPAPWWWWAESGGWEPCWSDRKCLVTDKMSAIRHQERRVMADIQCKWKLCDKKNLMLIERLALPYHNFLPDK